MTEVAHLSKHSVILYFPVVSLTPCNDHRLMGLWFPRTSLEIFCLAPCSILQAPRNFLTCGAQLVTPSLTTLIVSSLFHLHFLLELLPKSNLVWTWFAAGFYSFFYNLSCSHFRQILWQVPQKGSGMRIISISSTVNLSTQMVKFSNNGHSSSALLCLNHH